MEEELINLKWIDDFHLLALTKTEIFLLIDIQKRSVLNNFNLSNVKLIYNFTEV